MTGSDGVTVSIFGRDYTLRADGEESDLVELVRIVDGRMRDAATASGESSPLQVAILAALNLADDLRREREHRLRLADRAGRVADRLSDEVGKARATGVY
jgi:cell division protein ZapA (FtsZ GTPase activity inhibitor)